MTATSLSTATFGCFACSTVATGGLKHEETTMKAYGIRWVAGTVGALLLAGNLTLTATVNQRERRQQHRISAGVRSGELTGKETRKLEREQVRIRRDEAIAKSDGNFTPRERARIQKEQNWASRDIYRQKHDGQTR